mgnify:CR=1 FL=1|jgi:hypothetical protein
MNKDKKINPPDRPDNTDKKKAEDEKEKCNQRMDEEVEQTFPASDPPSYSQPHPDKKED